MEFILATFYTLIFATCAFYCVLSYIKTGSFGRVVKRVFAIFSVSFSLLAGVNLANLLMWHSSVIPFRCLLGGILNFCAAVLFLLGLLRLNWIFNRYIRKKNVDELSLLRKEVEFMFK